MMQLEPEDRDIDPDSKPYRRLWASVFKQGISDVCTARAAGAALESEPLRWFYSNEWHIGSFVWLCDLFEFGVEPARSRVLMRCRGFVDVDAIKEETNGRRRPSNTTSRTRVRVATRTTTTRARAGV